MPRTSGELEGGGERRGRLSPGPAGVQRSENPAEETENRASDVGGNSRVRGSPSEHLLWESGKMRMDQGPMFGSHNVKVT